MKERGSKGKFFLIGLLVVVALVFVVQALQVENQGMLSVSELGVTSLVNCNVRTDANGKLTCGSGGQWEDVASGISYMGGNVGIGNNNPSEKLDVNGNVRISELANCAGKIYTDANGKLICGSDLGITSESDPQVGILDGGDRWCKSDGVQINCNQSAPISGGGLKTFVGVTTQSYNGLEVGGYNGGNSKCSARFNGSRMCTAADFANGSPPVSVVNGWYSTFTTTQVGTYTLADCAGWKFNANSLGGHYWGGAPSWTTCNSQQVILCCG